MASTFEALLGHYVLPLRTMPEVLPTATCISSEYDRATLSFVTLVALHAMLVGLLRWRPTLQPQLHSAAHQGCMLVATCFFALNGWLGWWRLNDLMVDRGAVHTTHAGACVLGTS